MNDGKKKLDIIIKKTSSETVKSQWNEFVRLNLSVFVGNYCIENFSMPLLNGEQSRKYVVGSVIGHLCSNYKMYLEHGRLESKSSKKDFARSLGFSDPFEMLDAIDEVANIGKRIETVSDMIDCEAIASAYLEGDRSDIEEIVKMAKGGIDVTVCGSI